MRINPAIPGLKIILGASVVYDGDDPRYLGDVDFASLLDHEARAAERRLAGYHTLRGPIPGAEPGALPNDLDSLGALSKSEDTRPGEEPSSDGTSRALTTICEPPRVVYAEQAEDGTPSITILHGDYRGYLNNHPFDGTFDHVITDPPYNLRPAGDDIALEGRSAMKRDFGGWDENWQAAPFVAAMTRLVRPGGSLISFTSDRLISEFRESAGWKGRGTLVWVKANPAPQPRPGYVQATEFLVWLQREGAPATWNADGYTVNVLRHPVCAGNERTDHPTQKPEKLLEELIERHTNPGDLIFDPFMGSGTTLVAAKRLGRRAIGIDIDADSCRDAARRVHNAVYEKQDGLPFEV